MSLIKTKNKVKYSVQIKKTLDVPEWMLEDAKRKYETRGLLAAIVELRSRFENHYGEMLEMLISEDIVNDLVMELNLKEPEL